MGNSHGYQLIAGNLCDIFSLKYNTSRFHRNQACKRMKGCRLSGSVGSDEGNNVPLLYLEGDTLERLDHAVIDA